MAQLITVRFSRGDAQPWGLRLQGGKDFGTPLVVQKVNMGSIADQAGLQVGDALIKVNEVDAFNMRHKDAQDLIINSGNAFELTVQRGGGTWRPSVTPTGAVPSPTPSYASNGHVQTVTKTSLAHQQPDVKHIGSGYNNAARPFGQNGAAADPVKSIVNKQYNTPVGIYSEESIAETLSAQAEVLAGGVLGVNFKKNEKVYNSANSEVLKALQEAESDPSEPAGSNFFWSASHAVGGAAFATRAHTPSFLKSTGDSEPIIPQPQPQQLPQHAPVLRSKSPASAPRAPAAHHYEVPATSALHQPFNQPQQQHQQPQPLQQPLQSAYPPAYPAGPIQTVAPPTAATADHGQTPSGVRGPPCDDCGVGIVNTKLSANTISAALNAHHLNGSSNNQLNSSLGGPKPFNYAAGPPAAGPKSPGAPAWSKPQPPQPQQQSYAAAAPVQNYATLPRPAAHNAPAADQARYKRGQATELLEQSLQKLKAHEKDDFRSQAGKIISLMLENRLPSDVTAAATSDAIDGSQKSEAPVKPIKPTGHHHHPQQQRKPHSHQLPPLAIASETHFEDIFPSPPPPPPPMSSPPPLQLLQPSLPVLPPPPPLPLSADGVGERAPVVLRQRAAAVGEKMAHARDRRSFIDKDGIQNALGGCADLVASASALAKPIGGGESFVGGAGGEVFSVGSLALAPPTHQQQQPQPQPQQHQQQRSMISDDGLWNGEAPVCCVCQTRIQRGPFITALGKIWCPDHFVCVSQDCRRPLQDIGFVEEKGDLYCEYCFEKYLAPPCDKCNAKIKGDCLNAIGKHFHPECFTCSYCGKLFGNSPFFLEEGQAYCEADWNELFTTKCFACGFPVEAGDRWVEALSHNYHSQCFNCTSCKKNLEGQSFFAKGGRPYCKAHAR